MLKFPTLDEVDVREKTVLLRVDINSPVDKQTGEILDDTRIRLCAPTIKELSSKGAKVVVLAHQGRPGSDDFTTLEKHARKLSDAVGSKVDYVDDVLGPAAREAIKKMRPGEILLLENVRFYAEETLKGNPEEMSKTHLVQRLAKLVDIYVNDAFAAAHRKQPSLVGFGPVLPTYAGRLMERELKGLSRALEPEKPCVYVLGGAKFEDSLTIIEHVLEKNIADIVLTGGLVGHALLIAGGKDLGPKNMEILNKKGLGEVIDRAKNVIARYGEKVRTPLDVVVESEGKPVELDVNELPTDFAIGDIGSKTVEEYSKIISGAKTVVANGPLGIFEKKGFERGTFKVLEAMANSNAYTIIGGGHVVAAAQAAGMVERIKHVSTGGGACISFLSGESMPVVEMLAKVRS